MIPLLRSSLLLVLAFGLAVPALAADDDVEVEGLIEALGDSDVTVGGHTFLVTDATEIRGDHGADLTFEDLAVGMFVEAEGNVDAAGVLVADRIEVEDDGGDRVEVEALITALTDESLTVGGLTFAITPATEIRGTPELGARAEVRGRFTASGLVADRVRVENGGGNEDVEVRGPIESLAAAALTVQGHTFLVTDQTIIEDDDHRPIPFGSLGLGTFVEVHGRFEPDGSLVATRVEVEDRGEDEVEFTGTVEALADASITVSGVTFAVDDATLITDNENQPIPFSALQVGLVVEIRGETNAAGDLIATDIHVEDPFEDEVEAKAAIDAVADSALVVLGRPFLVTPQTGIFGLSGQPIGLDALAAGQVVEVHAQLDLDGSLVALRIDRDDTPADRIRLRAAVTAVGTDGLEVVGVAFTVDAATIILDRDGTPATLADLAIEQRVAVDALVDGAARRATRIEIERSTQIVGRVTTTGTGTFGLPGLRVTYGTATVFVDEAGRPFAPSQLAPGHAVRVVGTAGASAMVAATRVVAALGAATVGTSPAGSHESLTLEAPAPNPVTVRAAIRYTLEVAETVHLAVFDVRGREVRRLADGPQAAGTHEATFDAAGLPGGVYLVRLQADGSVATQRVTVVR